MPTKPKNITLTGTSQDVINAVRNSASTNYREYVPVATKGAEDIRKIGAVIMDYPALQNEFLQTLANRIARVLVTSKQFYNPWVRFKRGLIDFGETVEEVFVNIAKPFQYDPEIAETNVFKREIPDVKSAFHVMNYKKFYKTTIQESDLRKAFLSDSGMTDLIGKIIEQLYTGANYDEFLTMKYLIARNILDGHMNTVQIPEVNTDNMKTITAAVKATSNMMTFPDSGRNVAKVFNFTPKEKQMIIISAKYEAYMDVEVLASAFNMDKVQFMGQRVLVDSFGSLPDERLEQLFKDDSAYTKITEDEKKRLDAIPLVVVNEDWFMIFDNNYQFREMQNGEGLYWNYWYHVWKTFSTSPFADTALFVPGAPIIKSVKITPENTEAKVGETVQLSATVETDFFAPQSVTYSVDEPSKATVTAGGSVTILEGADGSVTVTATSTYDKEKKGMATITIQAE